MQYGILVYECSAYSNLLPIYNLQKKILKLIYFRKKSDSANDIFVKKIYWTSTSFINIYIYIYIYIYI